MKKLNKKVCAVAGLGALAAIGGTFAYYTASNSLDNPLSTGKYRTVLVEEYTPPEEDMEPGAKWDKTAGAENTGDYPVLVRIKMEEEWQYKGGNKPYKTIDSSSELFKNDIASPLNATMPEFYLAQQIDENGVINEIGDTDGLTPTNEKGDGTVIHKNIELFDSTGTITGEWIFNQNDGYWYWNRILEEAGTDKNSKTSNLLNGLVVTTNIDLGHYETKEYYQILGENETAPSAASTTGWTEVNYNDVTDVWPEDTSDNLIDIRDYLTKNNEFPIADGKKLYRMSLSAIDEKRKGYADSNYTLTITAEFVQATKDAAVESFGKEDNSGAKSITELPSEIQALINNLNTD